MAVPLHGQVSSPPGIKGIDSLFDSGVKSEPGEGAMTVERALRGMAGFFVLISVGLGHWHSPYWLLFTAFVGLNLLQSSFTKWCPMITFLRKLGVQE